MIIILFSLFAIGYSFPSFNYINKLENADFTAEITNTGIKLNDYNIKYETLKETNDNYKKLQFDNIIKGSEYSISYVKSTISQKYFKFDMVHEIASNYTIFLNCVKKFAKYEDNKLYVSMNIQNWEFENKDNELVFEFSIDTLSNLIGNNTVIFSDYQINFNKYSNADGNDKQIYLYKVNQKYKLYLPYFEHNLYYDFVISYKR